MPNDNDADDRRGVRFGFRRRHRGRRRRRHGPRISFGVRRVGRRHRGFGRGGRMPMGRGFMRGGGRR